MRRREFVRLLGGAAAMWPLAARTQQGQPTRRIGVLLAFNETDSRPKGWLSRFAKGLSELGWANGGNLRMDVRWAGDDVDRMRLFAKELVGLKPDVILAFGTPVTAALQRETRTIPIVFAIVSDPVGEGFVASLSRPGGNITGFHNSEASIGGKWLELLTEVAPGVKRAAMIFNPDTAPGHGKYYMPDFEAAARTLNVAPLAAPVHSLEELEAAITGLGREPGGSFIAMADFFLLKPSRADDRAGGAKQCASGLSVARGPDRGRFAIVRPRSRRHRSPRRSLCRSHSPRRKPGGASGSSTGEIRDGCQRQNRQGTRP